MDSFKLYAAVNRVACVLHRSQVRKGDTGGSYYVHPVGVGAVLLTHMVDVVAVCAGLLHDTVEDCPFVVNDTKLTTIHEKLDELNKRIRGELESYGESLCFYDNAIAQILKAVYECTDDKTLSKVDRKKFQLESAHSKSDNGKLVKLADKIDNISSEFPSSWSKEYCKGYVIWSYCVCLEASGVNKSIDEHVKKVYQPHFEQFGIESFDTVDCEYVKKELDTYYSLCV